VGGEIDVRLDQTEVTAESARIVDVFERVENPHELVLQRSCGLGALGRGGHLVWIAVYSVLIWLVASTGPILIGFWAFGPEVVDFASPREALLTSWVLLAAVGVAAQQIVREDWLPARSCNR